MAKAIEIMKMKQGMKLDEEIEGVIKDILGDIDIEGELGRYRSYSRDPLAALQLWAFASQVFGSVGLVHFGDAPVPVSQFCSIKDSQDENNHVTVLTGDWMESLSKAFLLFCNELYGDYEGSEWEQQKAEVPATRFLN